MLRSEDLSEHAAKGEAEKVDRRQVKALNERSGIRRHLFHRIGRPAGRTTDAKIVERDDWTRFRNAIDHFWIPGIHRSREML
ncbi:hypothetical protein GCM10023158_08430 [Gluconacetobacter tumulicola]